MANCNPSKNSKKLMEIAVQIGRNQSIQHCIANFLRKTIPTKIDKIQGDKPTKEEFLSLLWDEIESLVSDISEYVEISDTDIIKPEKIVKTTRKKLF